MHELLITMFIFFVIYLLAMVTLIGILSKSKRRRY